MQPCPHQQREAILPMQREHKSHWREDGTCSYCGSLSPDEFLRLAEEGVKVVPTDKNYKAYVGDSDQKKFYFRHLDDEGRARFVDLYNEDKVNLGYPGYFYVLPFFMVRSSPDAN